jgi:hypothetical protein
MPWDQVMRKFKSGTLRSGDTTAGPSVQNPRQAVAIMLSEKRKAAQGDTEYQPKPKRRLPNGSKDA